MKKQKKLLTWLVMLALALSLTACGGSQEETTPETSKVTENTEADESNEVADDEKQDADDLPTVDPSGAEINIPEEINSIVVLAPSIAETVIALGYGDKIVGYDAQSDGIKGLPADVPVFDMVSPDMEQMAALHPDVLLVSSLSLYDQEAPYQQLIDMGVCVMCIPTSDSIADIQNDIAFLAVALGDKEKGDALIAEMQAEIDNIKAIAETITEKKHVYFEIAAAPDMYSFGSGVYMNEMLELVGAENILADQEGWLGVTEEVVVEANPDVILTNVNYIENPTEEIMGRSGWDVLTAVKNQQVYYIDNAASSQPNQNIVKALRQMAEAIYPEYYGE